MTGKWLLLPLTGFALLAALPLRGEVFELWPWKGGGIASGTSRIGELPGTVTQLHTEKMQVNGVPLEMKVAAVNADFPSLLAALGRLFRPEDLRAGSDAVRVAYKLDKDSVERWLLVDAGPGKPATLFVIVAPEKLPPPGEWPTELPPLPPGAVASQIVRFPARKAVYGSFRNGGGDPERLAAETGGRLRAAGWRALGNEIGGTGGGKGGIFLHDKPRRILWAGYGEDGGGIFYSRPY